MNIQGDVNTYSLELNDFIERQKIPESWLEQGPDHIAYKAYNPPAYDQLVNQIRPITGFIAETWLDNRRIAAAKLLGEHAVNIFIKGNEYSVDWLELMEARVDDHSEERTRFDHMEIYVPRGLVPIRKVLGQRNLMPEPLSGSNRNHAWISVVFGRDGDELKFTEKPLSEIVRADVGSNRATIL